MTRLPAIRKLAETIERDRSGKHSVASSAAYLLAHKAELDRFEDLEHLAISTDLEYALPGTDEVTIRMAKGLSYHILTIRSAVARELWSRQVFVDSDVLDELIFYVARAPQTTNIVTEVLTWIRDARVTRPGFMVFPLHSFGVLSAGLLTPSRGRISYVNPEYGYAVTPQTNSMERAIDFMEQVRVAFGVRKALPMDLLQHWHRNVVTKWLERNPLLLQRSLHLPGSYYGNEWLLLSRVRATAGLLTMLAALQRPPTDEATSLFSTRRMNNWQTLDIHHYLTLYDGVNQRRELDGHRVPIHDRSFVSELSALEIEIDPAQWNRRSAESESVHAAVEQLYTEYLRVRVTRPKPNAQTRTVTKLYDSLGWFRRSHRSTAGEWAAKVNLATAFETLLTDHYGSVQATLQRRTSLLLRGVRGTKAMQVAVGDLYHSRSALVHTGDDSVDVDFRRAREAYVRCFTELVNRLPGLNHSASEPIRVMTEDAV